MTVPSRINDLLFLFFFAAIRNATYGLNGSLLKNRENSDKQLHKAKGNLDTTRKGIKKFLSLSYLTFSGA